jgi:hypothetical protein
LCVNRDKKVQSYNFRSVHETHNGYSPRFSNDKNADFIATHCGLVRQN